MNPPTDPDEISEQERREAIATTKLLGEVVLFAILTIVATGIILAALWLRHHHQ